VTNLDKLRILGEALHGPRWMRALARDLGVNYRTMLRWNAGERAIGDKIIAELLAIAERRKIAIHGAIQCSTAT
jgi:transposase-like protein